MAGISPTKQSAKECQTDQGHNDEFNRSTDEIVFTYTTMNHKNIKLNWTICQIKSYALRHSQAQVETLSITIVSIIRAEISRYLLLILQCLAQKRA